LEDQPSRHSLRTFERRKSVIETEFGGIKIMEQTNGQKRGLRPFTAGDPRINRKGRPKGFDEFRRLAQGIACEKVTLPDGNKLTVIEAILRSWAKSTEPALQKAFVEYCYGRPPDRLEVDELKPKTRLILHWGHSMGEDGHPRAKVLPLPPDPDGVHRQWRRNGETGEPESKGA
jgi:hypothetical protein